MGNDSCAESAILTEFEHPAPARCAHRSPRSGHRQRSAGAKRRATIRCGHVAQQGSRTFKRACPAVPPEDNIRHLWRTAIGRKLDTGGHLSRKGDLSLERSRTELCSRKSVHQFDTRYALQQSAWRCAATSAKAREAIFFNFAQIGRQPLRTAVGAVGYVKGVELRGQLALG